MTNTPKAGSGVTEIDALLLRHGTTGVVQHWFTRTEVMAIVNDLRSSQPIASPAAGAGAGGSVSEVLKDAASMLRKYHRLCVGSGKGDSFWLVRILEVEAACRASATPSPEQATTGGVTDAERYQYMRNNATFSDRNGPGLYWYLPRYMKGTLAERLDQAIDAAILSTASTAVYTCRVNPQYTGPANCTRGTVGCTVPGHRQTMEQGHVSRA